MNMNQLEISDFLGWQLPKRLNKVALELSEPNYLCGSFLFSKAAIASE